MKSDWEKKAVSILKSELARREVSYDLLQKKLAHIGVEETAGSINSKINRGAFQFAFFLQVMQAIGVKTIRLDEEV